MERAPARAVTKGGGSPQRARSAAGGRARSARDGHIGDPRNVLCPVSRRERGGGSNRALWQSNPRAASGQRRNPTRSKAARPEDRHPRIPNPTPSKASENLRRAERSEEIRRPGFLRGSNSLQLDEEVPWGRGKCATVVRMADSLPIDWPESSTLAVASTRLGAGKSPAD